MNGILMRQKRNCVQKKFIIFATISEMKAEKVAERDSKGAHDLVVFSMAFCKRGKTTRSMVDVQQPEYKKKKKRAHSV